MDFQAKIAIGHLANDVFSTPTVEDDFIEMRMAIIGILRFLSFNPELFNPDIPLHDVRLLLPGKADPAEQAAFVRRFEEEGYPLD